MPLHSFCQPGSRGQQINVIHRVRHRNCGMFPTGNDGEVGVRWYLKFNVSYRHLAERMQERGFLVHQPRSIGGFRPIRRN